MREHDPGGRHRTGEPVELSKLLRTLRREWLAGLIAFAVVLELSVLLAGPGQEMYRSSSTLFVQPSVTNANSVSVQGVQFLMPALEARVASSTMRDEVRRGLRGEVAASLWEATATTDPGTGLLRLTVVSSDPAVPPPVAEGYSARLRDYADESEIPVSITVLEPPGPALAQSSRRWLALLLSGGVLGLGAAVAAALLAARIRRPRRLADQVRDRYGVAVLGEIPRAGRGVDLTPAALHAGEDQRIVEGFMRVRTSVEIALSARRLRSIAVVSAGAGEGKTTVTSHLAWNLASLGHRVLLVDGDLRHAWMDVLIGGSVERDIPASWVKGVPADSTAVPKLAYLSAVTLRTVLAEGGGSRTAHPAEVVSAAMPAVAHAARDSDALLLVDCPPILGAAEGRYIVSVVDAVVVVVDARRGLALEDLEETLRQVRETGGTVLGVVLNRARLARTRKREEERYYIDRTEWAAVAEDAGPVEGPEERRGVFMAGGGSIPVVPDDEREAEAGPGWPDQGTQTDPSAAPVAPARVEAPVQARLADAPEGSAAQETSPQLPDLPAAPSRDSRRFADPLTDPLPLADPFPRLDLLALGIGPAVTGAPESRLASDRSAPEARGGPYGAGSAAEASEDQSAGSRGSSAGVAAPPDQVSRPSPTGWPARD